MLRQQLSSRSKNLSNSAHNSVTTASRPGNLASSWAQSRTRTSMLAWQSFLVLQPPPSQGAYGEKSWLPDCICLSHQEHPCRSSRQRSHPMLPSTRSNNTALLHAEHVQLAALSRTPLAGILARTLMATLQLGPSSARGPAHWCGPHRSAPSAQSLSRRHEQLRETSGPGSAAPAAAAAPMPSCQCHRRVALAGWGSPSCSVASRAVRGCLQG